MAHYEYYSNMRTIMEASRASHISLIERVCTDLGASDKVEELVAKYIDDSIRIKKFKDKRAPKRPKSGYMMYCEKRRDAVKNAKPNASFAEVIQALASEWKALSDKAKEQYNQLAEDDKNRYCRELEEYKSEIYKTNVGASA